MVNCSGPRQARMIERVIVPDFGIIGFERSGKTSLFNAVTGQACAVGFATHTDPHVGVVKVPDPRLDRLSALLEPKKTTPASLQYVDFPGAGFGGGHGPDARFLDQLSKMDALIHLVRAFESETVPHPQNSVDPARDIGAMTLELAFADLALVEKRLERIAAEMKAMKASERDLVEREDALLHRIQEALSNDIPVRAQSLNDEERRQLRHYRFLTDRPLLTVVNVNESDAARAEAIAAQHRPATEYTSTTIVAVSAALEMELRELSLEDAAEYRREAVGRDGGEDVLATAVRLSYQVLGLHSFFTVGKDECRAWTVRVGATAHQSAGRIHSDLERGFIRAEVVHCEDLLAAGSEAEAKKRAQLHTEGKEYIVQDGDVMHVLFNV